MLQKILKSKFTAYTVEQVLEHDKRVRKNWDLFQKGRLHVDEELTAHYAKFVGRLKFETNRKGEKKVYISKNFMEIPTIACISIFQVHAYICSCK